MVNPGYPTVYSTAAACAITVKKCSDGKIFVLQLKHGKIFILQLKHGLIFVLKLKHYNILDFGHPMGGQISL